MKTQTVWNMNGFPKVGIRPIIDGRRRGVRESLEVQTMKMAETAAKLISSNLRYPDGSPVECVIADTTIGGVYEAEQCAKKGEAVPVIGAKEFRYMAESYNKLTGAKEENEEDDD